MVVVDAMVDVVEISGSDVDGGASKDVVDVEASPPMQPHRKTTATRRINARITLTMLVEIKIITRFMIQLVVVPKTTRLIEKG